MACQNGKPFRANWGGPAKGLGGARELTAGPRAWLGTAMRPRARQWCDRTNQRLVKPDGAPIRRARKREPGLARQVLHLHIGLQALTEQPEITEADRAELQRTEQRGTEALALPAIGDRN